MTPSHALKAMNELRDNARAVQKLAMQCNQEQRDARKLRGEFMALSECPSYHALQHATQVRRRGRDFYEV